MLKSVHENRCDVRMFTPIPRSVAIVTVELMLVLRVLALCGLTHIHIHQFLILLRVFCLLCIRWKLNGKDVVYYYYQDAFSQVSWFWI